ncbi:hypothetical protein P0W76_21860, partial [Tsukamurella sp. 8J]|nr:hypothetical protein [Tsukamurella sp. 8J]
MSSRPQRTLPPGYRMGWLARRPPETLPPRPTGSRGPRPTPRYPYIPRWGLHQDFESEPSEQPSRWASWAAAARFTLTLAAALLTLAAAAEIATYILLVINRGRMVSGTAAFIVEFAAFVLGYAAVLTVVFAAFTVAAW